MAIISSSQLFILLAVAAIFNTPPALMAVDHIVGDDNGWTTEFNYTTWVQGKTFYLHDNLIFKYEKGSHNVFRVNMTEFQQCRILGKQPVMETGNDVIPLTKSGKKWYICGVEDHCSSGQKLVITVLDQIAPATSPSPLSSETIPPPPPPSAATRSAVSGVIYVQLISTSAYCHISLFVMSTCLVISLTFN